MPGKGPHEMGEEHCRGGYTKKIIKISHGSTNNNCI
jgi:hypothetical protein